MCGRSAAIARQEARWVETTAYGQSVAGTRTPGPGADRWMCQPDRRTLRPNSREHRHAGHSVFLAAWRAVHANAGRIWRHRFDDRRQQRIWLDVDLAADVRSGRRHASGSQAACQALETNGAAALPPVPKDKACTQIYGGPETATITGTWQGQRVISRFARNDGCQIGRWKLMEGLLPRGGT